MHLTTDVIPIRKGIAYRQGRRAGEGETDAGSGAELVGTAGER